jgi:hypothetical protein
MLCAWSQTFEKQFVVEVVFFFHQFIFPKTEGLTNISE